VSAFVCGLRLLVPLHGCATNACSLEDSERLRNVRSSSAFCNVTIGALGRELLSNRHVDELIEGHAFGFGRFAGFLEKRWLWARGEIDLLHRCCSNAITAAAGANTEISNRLVAG